MLDERHCLVFQDPKASDSVMIANMDRYTMARLKGEVLKRMLGPHIKPSEAKQAGA